MSAHFPTGALFFEFVWPGAGVVAGGESDVAAHGWSGEVDGVAREDVYITGAGTGGDVDAALIGEEFKSVGRALLGTKGD